MDTGRMIMMIVTLIIVLVIFYYLLQVFYSSSGVDDLVIYSGDANGGGLVAKPVTAKDAYVGASIVPQIYPGGEYSISTWIYVKSWSITSAKPFLTLSGGGNTYLTAIMYLGKTTNKLGIQVGTASSGTAANTFLSSTGPGVYPSDLTSANGAYADTTQNALDVDKIDLQRWVNITLVLSGNNADVFIDGKLARSSILPNPFVADGSKPTMTLGDNVYGFNGIIGKTRAANYAYTPDVVYTIYQEGPFSTFSLSSLNPFQYTLTLSNANGTLFKAGR